MFRKKRKFKNLETDLNLDIDPPLSLEASQETDQTKPQEITPDQDSNPEKIALIKSAEPKVEAAEPKVEKEMKNDIETKLNSDQVNKSEEKDFDVLPAQDSVAELDAKLAIKDKEIALQKKINELAKRRAENATLNYQQQNFADPLSKTATFPHAFGNTPATPTQPLANPYATQPLANPLANPYATQPYNFTPTQPIPMPAPANPYQNTQPYNYPIAPNPYATQTFSAPQAPLNQAPLNVLPTAPFSAQPYPNPTYPNPTYPNPFAPAPNNPSQAFNYDQRFNLGTPNLPEVDHTHLVDVTQLNPQNPQLSSFQTPAYKQPYDTSFFDQQNSLNYNDQNLSPQAREKLANLRFMFNSGDINASEFFKARRDTILDDLKVSK